jgi:hypothetical protein
MIKDLLKYAAGFVVCFLIVLLLLLVLGWEAPA